ncbi:MAG: hypothetical protein CM1200mP18_02410 [Gammaproteobacteria bacterium]|nr:MAG: hypothetical protein CM1200mP18_02410 [Gammaproteobacteria bacterium]
MRENIGFFGLGNIGKPIAANIAQAGYEMSVYDVAGTGGVARRDLFWVHRGLKLQSAQTSSSCVCPVSSISAVVSEISETNCRDNVVVVNTSTCGPTAAQAAHDVLGRKRGRLCRCAYFRFCGSGDRGPASRHVFGERVFIQARGACSQIVW